MPPWLTDYDIEDRPHEWDRRWWSPIQNAEHLAMRERVGMVDLSPFVIFDFTGPGVLAYLQHMAVNNVEVKVGRSVYTPLLTEVGWLQVGPDHASPRRGALPGHHRRLRRATRQALVLTATSLRMDRCK